MYLKGKLIIIINGYSMWLFYRYTSGYSLGKKNYRNSHGLFGKFGRRTGVIFTEKLFLFWLIEKLIAPSVVAVIIVSHRGHEVAARTSWLLFVYF